MVGQISLGILTFWFVWWELVVVGQLVAVVGHMVAVEERIVVVVGMVVVAGTVGRRMEVPELEL